jgi:hypothetical protein
MAKITGRYYFEIPIWHNKGTGAGHYWSHFVGGPFSFSGFDYIERSQKNRFLVKKCRELAKKEGTENKQVIEGFVLKQKLAYVKSSMKRNPDFKRKNGWSGSTILGFYFPSFVVSDAREAEKMTAEKRRKDRDRQRRHRAGISAELDAELEYEENETYALPPIY